MLGTSAGLALAARCSKPLGLPTLIGFANDETEDVKPFAEVGLGREANGRNLLLGPLEATEGGRSSTMDLGVS